MITLLGHVDNPQEAISNHLKESERTGIAFSWHLQEYWRPSDHIISLATIFCTKDNLKECIVSDQVEFLLEEAELIKSYEDFVHLSEKAGLTRLQLDQPLSLQPLHIAKPWGQEIWFTGIEERGVCLIETLPLPWLISMAPEALTGLPYEDPILLKILDPQPTPVYGDLYFEMHEEKREVYVVTHLDEMAWPEETGAIRFGFEPSVFSDYSSTSAFLSAYEQAVSTYEKTRRSIDSQLDDLREEDGVGVNEIVSPDRLLAWRSKISPALIESELEQRETMENFTHIERLKKGDVIQVPPMTPHALQHGVRVIEFQSPHYERFIISFAQKVMTQDHWDTKEALAKVDLEKLLLANPLNENPVNNIELVSNKDGCLIEKIVSFDRFEAYRINLEQGATYAGDYETYVIVIGLTGKLVTGKIEIEPEAAYYLTTLASPFLMECDEPIGASFLLALPVNPDKPLGE